MVQVLACGILSNWLGPAEKVSKWPFWQRRSLAMVMALDELVITMVVMGKNWGTLDRKHMIKHRHMCLDEFNTHIIG